jgi:ribose-phosphate pyrophosphokinase
MLIIEGPAGNGIGRKIASKLGFDLLETRHKVFPDGESEVGIEGPVKGKDVLIVQSTYPSQDKRLIELLLLADDAKKQGAKSIGAIVPYLAYARQDKKFEGKNNTVSINTILNLMNFAGITTLVTVSPHSAESLSAFNGVVKTVNAVTSLANELKKSMNEKSKNDFFVLAPDEGASNTAKQFAKVIGCGHAHIDKQRDRLTGEISVLNTPKCDLKGKEVIVVDDLISTGGTVAQAARFAFDNGASRVIVAASHLLMAEDAYEKIKASGVSELYGTNTIPFSKAHMADISGAIAEVLDEKARNLRR